MIPSERRLMFLLLFLTLVSRIPFLFSGYGAEEDAWALPLVAERIAHTGHYEMSRLPGHPVQELTYAMMAGWGPLAFNLCTLLISTVGVLFFALVLHHAGSASWWLGGLMLAFTPLYYINSTNAMDYTWSIAFMTGTLYFVLRRNMILAGILLALATGCRITSLALLLPMLILIPYLFKPGERTKPALLLCVCAVAGAALLFGPVYLSYGSSFFSFYKHFPIPGFLKNSYKGIIAVWGLPGLFALMFAAFMLIKRKSLLPALHPELQQGLIYSSLLAILLFTIAFIRLPLKAAFMLPVVPFVILLIPLCCNERQIRLPALLMPASCFFFGLNLAEAERGSGRSSAAIVMSIQSQEVAVDPLQGLVLADHSKRINRSRFTERVLEQCMHMPDTSVLICGWWQSELLVRKKNKPVQQFEMAHYLDEEAIRLRLKAGKKVYYLVDQWQYNDERFGSQFTRNLATAFPLP